MIECALFGAAHQKFVWPGREFARTELVYSNGNDKIIVVKETRFGDDCSAYLVWRGHPDRNRQRRTIVSEICKCKLQNGSETGQLLEAIGYALVGERKTSGLYYNRPRYRLEVVPCNENEMIVNLVKAFVEVTNVAEGEALLNEAYNDIIDYVELINPPLSWFE